MTAAKRKITVSIDAELVDELERGDDGPLSQRAGPRASMTSLSG
jgi:hypothetical protein